MIEKKYNHLEVEKNKYDYWKKEGFFQSGDLKKEAFSIVIPPPNVTGRLHLGHAWDTTLQDIIVRYKRMQGYDALWLPGMDHAGIATQAKIDEKLKNMGYKPREMDRNDWLKHAWSWKEEYANIIYEQWAKLGLSLDYSKERFTLDEGFSKAVTKVFVDLYNKGLIYRGERIINWDPEAMTALSNEEVIYKEVEGEFYYIKYYLEDKSDYLTIATTRPETLFGDTAVAVNPSDERYKHLIGKRVILPISERLIPIIADEYADMEFGTGAVKVTPAHDPNDFEIGIRHNLKRILVINKDGTMNEHAHQFKGLDRFKCREELVKELEKQGLLVKVEKIVHSVGHSERTGIMIEPYLSKQWFVKMKPLAERVIKMQKAENKINFIPKRFEKILLHWMEISHDWCISRQLWWGHRIPAWYKGDEIYVGETPPQGEGWIQNPDVLDTWFSSALWPFATFGWPEDTDDLKRYFPINVLVTGYDIIFFWVCRMAFQSLEFTGKVPFKECLIHGLIRDHLGRKMSKSLGNGVDPMDVIDKYGADSLRYFLATSSAPGQDLRYSDEKVAAAWNFINKIWNASRFVLMKMEEEKPKEIDLSTLTLADKWILTRLNETIKDATRNMEKYEFGEVGRTLYNFIWNDFCDWYIETSKININISVLVYVLSNILKLLHPFMPFVTEEIYTKVTKEKTIMLASWPKEKKEYNFKKEAEKMELLREMVKEIRNIRNEYKITKDEETILVYETNNDLTELLILENKEYFYKFTKVLKLLNKKEFVSTDEWVRYSISLPNIVLTLMAKTSEADIKKELERLEAEKKILEVEVKRAKGMLSNENFIKKAPISKVEEEKKKLLDYEDQLKKVIEQINSFNKQ